MECSLKKSVPEEHQKESEPRYNLFVNCPLFDSKQICFWCCLHIRDMAEPLQRGYNSDMHPEYAERIPELSGRVDWDEVWHVCSSCSA